MRSSMRIWNTRKVVLAWGKLSQNKLIFLILFGNTVEEIAFLFVQAGIVEENQMEYRVTVTVLH